MRFRERLERFMSGRYGNDQLNNLLLIAVLVIIFVNIFFNSYIVTLAYLALWGWSVFRSMSRNIYKRRKENEIFLKVWGPISGKFKLMKNKHRDRKTHVYKKCPQCKSILRLPKRKGKHTVKCPICDERFDVVI